MEQQIVTSSGGLGVETFHQKSNFSVTDNIRARLAGSPVTWIAPELILSWRLSLPGLPWIF
jgi:hypothetical protein